MKTEPGTVGRLLAAFKALEFISGKKNVQALTIVAFSKDETLEVIGVSWIWKDNEKQNILKIKNLIFLLFFQSSEI
jgi:hypothetical protein